MRSRISFARSSPRMGRVWRRSGALRKMRRKSRWLCSADRGKRKHGARQGQLMRLVLKLLVLAAILCAAAVLMVEGARLMRVAEAMPAYTDPGLAHSLRLTMPHELEEYRKDGRAFTRRWHEKMAALRTDKWQVYDRGRTMIVLALCVLGAVLLFRLWRDHAVANIRTPSRGTLFWLGVTTYFSIVPPFWIMLLDQQRREYLPWWASGWPHQKGNRRQTVVPKHARARNPEISSAARRSHGDFPLVRGI